MQAEVERILNASKEKLYGTWTKPEPISTWREMKLEIAPKVCKGPFESHTSIFVAAENFELAKLEAKKSELLQQFRIHIDGPQEFKPKD